MCCCLFRCLLRRLPNVFLPFEVAICKRWSPWEEWIGSFAVETEIHIKDCLSYKREYNEKNQEGGSSSLLVTALTRTCGHEVVEDKLSLWTLRSKSGQISCISTPLVDCQVAQGRKTLDRVKQRAKGEKKRQQMALHLVHRSQDVKNNIN